MHFLPFSCYFLPPHHFSSKLAKNAFWWPKSKKTEESRPQLFLNFTYKYGPWLFLGALWAEKITFSQKTGRDRFGWTQFLYKYIMVEAKSMVSSYNFWLCSYILWIFFCTKFWINFLLWPSNFELLSLFECIWSLIGFTKGFGHPIV